MTSLSSKCLAINISVIFGNRKKSLRVRSGEYTGCSDTVICLAAKNLPHRQCLVSRSIVMTQFPRVVRKMNTFSHRQYTEQHKNFGRVRALPRLSGLYPDTGFVYLDTGFSRFPCVYKQTLRRFPTFQVATTCFSCSPPDLNLLVTNFMFCIHVK